MDTEWSNERVRQLADQEYVQPAKNSHTAIRIQQGELYDKARRLGLPQNHANRIGTAIESPKFWEARGLEMVTPRGQSRSKSTIYEFRFRDQHTNRDSTPSPEVHVGAVVETPSERALRLSERVRGLLKDEIAAYGGTEAFMRWVRSDEEDAN